jgi:hypothetical protein
VREAEVCPTRSKHSFSLSRAHLTVLKGAVGEVIAFLGGGFRFQATSLSLNAILYIYNSESLQKAQAECAYSFGPRSLGPGPWPWGPTWYAAMLLKFFFDKTGAQLCDLLARGVKTLICR